jgi:hypothetical protein
LDHAVELRYAGPSKDTGIEKIGRKTNTSLDNLHISREQLFFKLQVDRSGQLLTTMYNVSFLPFSGKLCDESLTV